MSAAIVAENGLPLFTRNADDLVGRVEASATLGPRFTATAATLNDESAGAVGPHHQAAQVLPKLKVVAGTSNQGTLLTCWRGPMEFLETSVYSRAADSLLTDEEQRELQNLLLNRPHAGALLKRSGSLREVRFGTGDRGDAASGAYLDNPDPRAIRDQLSLSREQFAALIGVSERTVEGWEQGRRRPSGPALTLLRVAARHPESVLDTMRVVSSR